MCDTFVVCPEKTANGKMLFGKNSDREANEPQFLEVHPRRMHAPASEVRCTYLTIPQVEETQAVILSRPFWMWGGEIGVNAAGVAIGNEAVWSRIPPVKEKRLTGMDLLRLGLERASTAETALETILSLLHDHGQGGNCGHTSKLYYHNSYIIADAAEAWILEIVDRYWIAQRVQGQGAISNGLSIGAEYDEIHPELIQVAQSRGWLKRHQDFNFTELFSDRFYTTFSACRTRHARAEGMLAQQRYDLPAAFAHLRDHGDDHDYRPDNHFLMNHVCAHAGASPARQASQSTSSMVVQLGGDEPEIWATASSAPCLSVFKPISFNADVLEPQPVGTGAFFNTRQFWWNHELLHRSVLKDYSDLSSRTRSSLGQLESQFVQQIYQGQPIDNHVTESAFNLESDLITQLLSEQLPYMPDSKMGWMYTRFWNKMNNRARIRLPA